MDGNANLELAWGTLRKTLAESIKKQSGTSGFDPEDLREFLIGELEGLTTYLAEAMPKAGKSLKDEYEDSMDIESFSDESDSEEGEVDVEAATQLIALDPADSPPPKRTKKSVGKRRKTVIKDDNDFKSDFIGDVWHKGPHVGLPPLGWK